MKRFKKILYVNEPSVSETQIPQRILRLAQNNEARLTLCDVSHELPRSLMSLQQTFKSLHEKQLVSLVDGVETGEIDIKTKLLTGAPFIEVIKEVTHGKHDLVIKAAEGGNKVMGKLFGSTDMHLMRKCPCPVWVIKPAKNKKYARILAAVDPSPDIPANAELNKLILDLASSLARQEGSELHIVHTWFVNNEDLLRSRLSKLEESEIDEIVNDTKNTHQKWLDELLAGYDLEGVTTKVHLSKGEPGELIPELAQKEGVELIVMGTVARTGIPGFFIGNTAEKILAQVDCSVLTVKPQAFLTPVVD